MKTLFMTLFILIATQSESWAKNNILVCKDRSGLYEVQLQIDFTHSKNKFTKERYCMGRGECYDDPYDGYTCDCSNYKDYFVENITWPTEITLTTKSQVFEAKGIAIASGSKNGSSPLEFTTLNIYEYNSFPSFSTNIALRIHGSLSLLNRKFTSFTFRDDEDLYLSTNWLDFDDGTRYFLECNGLY